jgi:ribonuclease Z
LVEIRSTYDGPLSIAMDLMTWNITEDGVTERMAVSPDRASAVPGPSRQPPPDPSIPDPTSEFIRSGEWGPGLNAQNEMLDEFRDENGLGDADWRPAKPWYEPN